MKKIRAILILLIGFNMQAQEIFDYNYVIIPEKFEFQNRKHQYQLNSLLRVLFQEKGFQVFMNTEQKPDKLAADPCLALKVNVEKVSAFLTSKFQIKMINCLDEVVYQSKIGKSRSKAYEDGYSEAIKDAFTSIQKLERNKNRKDKKATAVQIKSSTTAEQKMKKQSITYKKDGKSYQLIHQADQYELYQDDIKIADIIPAEDGSFLYKSQSLNGIARFTPQGDLIITYKDQDIGRSMEMTYYKIQE